MVYYCIILYEILCYHTVMIYCSAQEFNIFFAQIHEFNKDGHEPIHTELISHFPSLAKTHANHI